MVTVVENGLEPEYLITDIVRAEAAAGGMIRLYLGCKKHRTTVVQFTVVASPADFAVMAKQVQDMAADRHNLAIWENMAEDEKAH